MNWNFLTSPAFVILAGTLGIGWTFVAGYKLGSYRTLARGVLNPNNVAPDSVKPTEATESKKEQNQKKSETSTQVVNQSKKNKNNNNSNKHNKQQKSKDQTKKSQEVEEGKKTKKEGEEESIADEDEGEWEDYEDECKMVLIVNSTLPMGKGKIMAQASHGAVGVVMEILENEENEQHREWLEMWEDQAQAKICLKSDEETMKSIQKQAEQAGLPNYLVIDAGRTQIPANSVTVLAVGPAPVSLIDPITGKLKLF